MMEMDRHSYFSKTSLVTNKKVHYFFQMNSPRLSESSFPALTILTQYCPHPSVSYVEQGTKKRNRICLLLLDIKASISFASRFSY